MASDVHEDLKRVHWLLEELNNHGLDFTPQDDPEQVETIRYAFLDAARAQVNRLLAETKDAAS